MYWYAGLHWSLDLSPFVLAGQPFPLSALRTTSLLGSGWGGSWWGWSLGLICNVYIQITMYTHIHDVYEGKSQCCKHSPSSRGWYVDMGSHHVVNVLPVIEIIWYDIWDDMNDMNDMAAISPCCKHSPSNREWSAEKWSAYSTAGCRSWWTWRLNLFYFF